MGRSNAAAKFVPAWLASEVGGIDEQALFQAVMALRNDETNADQGPGELYAILQGQGSFKNLTVAQVKQTDGKVQRSIARMKERAELQREEEARRVAEEAERERLRELEELDQGRIEPPHTSAAFCRVTGAGLVEACIRQPAYFWVEAYDNKGKKRTVGGDSFFVAVRGPARSRARIRDNEDGTYLVVWKPSTSGVCVSHAPHARATRAHTAGTHTQL